MPPVLKPYDTREWSSCGCKHDLSRLHSTVVPYKTVFTKRFVDIHDGACFRHPIGRE